jgi:hypothetical protein
MTNAPVVLEAAAIRLGDDAANFDRIKVGAPKVRGQSKYARYSYIRLGLSLACWWAMCNARWSPACAV